MPRRHALGKEQETHMIDPKKQYRTRDGREVRIYAVDGGDEFCVHGAIYRPSLGAWEPRQWPATGHLGGMSASDLIEVRPRIQREVWVNVYPELKCGAYVSKETADSCAAPRRIACVKLVIDCEEGHGLD
jgi:hypothetical protein